MRYRILQISGFLFIVLGSAMIAYQNMYIVAGILIMIFGGAFSYAADRIREIDEQADAMKQSNFGLPDRPKKSKQRQAHNNNQ